MRAATCGTSTATSTSTYHAGYGVNVVGHGNPHVVDAVQRRVTMGTHFAQPTPDSIEVARMLADRFGLPQWRFTNSGTEATMDAVHLAGRSPGATCW